MNWFFKSQEVEGIEQDIRDLQLMRKAGEGNYDEIVEMLGKYHYTEQGLKAAFLAASSGGFEYVAEYIASHTDAISYYDRVIGKNLGALNTQMTATMYHLTFQQSEIAHLKEVSVTNGRKLKELVGQQSQGVCYTP